MEANEKGFLKNKVSIEISKRDNYEKGSPRKAK